MESCPCFGHCGINANRNGSTSSSQDIPLTVSENDPESYTTHFLINRCIPVYFDCVEMKIEGNCVDGNLKRKKKQIKKKTKYWVGRQLSLQEKKTQTEHSLQTHVGPFILGSNLCEVMT